MKLFHEPARVSLYSVPRVLIPTLPKYNPNSLHSLYSLHFEEKEIPYLVEAPTLLTL
jgi:hypothetical protein